MSGRDSGRTELFNAEDIFDDDYLYFYDPILPAERTSREADTISNLLDLAPGHAVLDLGCGHGRISNELARRGLHVTGLDLTPHFLSLARAEAEAERLDVRYVEGDMRTLPWREAFDAAYIWFTTFGYFEDSDNERVLREVAAALKPGGRLLIEQVNRFLLIKRGLPQWDVAEVGTDLMIDKVGYDALTDRSETVRTTVRNGRVKRANFSVRLYSPAEIKARLLEAGFGKVEIFGRGGEPFTLYGNRLIVVARK